MGEGLCAFPNKLKQNPRVVAERRLHQIDEGTKKPDEYQPALCMDAKFKEREMCFYFSYLITSPGNIAVKFIFVNPSSPEHECMRMSHTSSSGCRTLEVVLDD